MKNGFEEKFMEIQEDMISYCIEYVQDAADFIYAYAAIEPEAQMFSAFFSKGNAVLNISDVNSNKMRMVRFLKDGKGCIPRIKALCSENGMKTPTQIKLYYDIKENHLSADYCYDLLFTGKEDADPVTLFNDWRSEVQKKVAEKESV